MLDPEEETIIQHTPNEINDCPRSWVVIMGIIFFILCFVVSVCLFYAIINNYIEITFED